MASKTVRVSARGHKTLRQLASETGSSMQKLLEQAIERLRRERFLQNADQAYDQLRSDPVAWQSELDERVDWRI